MNTYDHTHTHVFKIQNQQNMGEDWVGDGEDIMTLAIIKRFEFDNTVTKTYKSRLTNKVTEIK